MNYKIINTSVWLDKFTSLVISLFSKTAQIFCIRVEVFSVLLNFSSVSMLDAIKLLPENVFGYTKMSLKVIYGIIHSKTFQLLWEIVLYTLNTPGKLREKAQKKSWKTLDFLNYESVRTLISV